MEKHLTLIFYGSNGDAAKSAASRIRTNGSAAQLRDAVAYGGESEPCEAVQVLPDVSAFDRGRIEAAYGDKVQAPVERVKAKLSLPPAPAPAPPKEK